MFKPGDTLVRTGGTEGKLKLGDICEVKSILNQNYISLNGFKDSAFHVNNFEKLDTNTIPEIKFGQLTLELKNRVVNALVDGSVVYYKTSRPGAEWYKHNTFSNQGSLNSLSFDKIYKVVPRDKVEQIEKQLEEWNDKLEAAESLKSDILKNIRELKKLI